MHLRRLSFFSDRYPTVEYYPFSLQVFRNTRGVVFDSPVTFFVGENGTGKSTLLEALSHKCKIHIWRNAEGARFEKNFYEDRLCDFIGVEWTDGPVPGSFFSGELFRDFAHYLEEWAVRDPGNFRYFGGRSLITQSHGESLMSFFRSRYKVRGLYLLDEPETALSPRTQVELLRLIKDMSVKGHAQFIIATHSPILMACPGATIYSFNDIPVKSIDYEQTEHYRIYKDFMADRDKYL